jgi:hypothetical protein
MPRGPPPPARRIGRAPLKTFLALFTLRSTDALIFEADLAKIGQDGGVALYRHSIRTP